MRISDWSSDVCSSDLFDDVRMVLAVLGEQPLRELVVELAEQLAVVNDAGAFHFIATQTAVELHAADGRQIVLLGREERSEEHTSELQSLMRISYALFCLKKKRYIDTHQSTKLVLL